MSNKSAGSVEQFKYLGRAMTKIASMKKLRAD
jgi:hypothetical protein